MEHLTRRIGRFSVLISCLLTLSAASGATVNVASLPALEQALAAVQAGDEIVLADGVYASTWPIPVDCAGKADRPITIAAQSVGGAEIKGAAGFAIGQSAAYVVIRGFRLTHAGGAIALPAGSHHCRITRNVVELANTGKAPYIAVGGDDHEIDHNTLQNKHVEGPMITVQGPGRKELAQRTWIHHNYFYNFKPTANNCAAIQIGLSSRSMHSAGSLVEYNLFVKTAGENEGGVCKKSCDNVYRLLTTNRGFSPCSVCSALAMNFTMLFPLHEPLAQALPLPGH